MSTFSGKTREYPFISLDRFDGKNLDNHTFFLSHNHKDHTVGLFSDNFLYKLQSSNDVRIYCSPVTRDLLLLEDSISMAVQRNPRISSCFVALELEESHAVSVVNPDNGQVKESVTVTLLPAKHCPGSVMILIEGDGGTILYTGDFRLSRSELVMMQQLQSGNSVKSIKSLYIDTTFCVPEAMYIPPREQSVECATNVIDEWISQSPHHVVHLKHAAGLGYEQLYREISNHFNMKVHVNRKKFAEYKKVGDMHTFTTPNPAVTQIHACRSMEGGGKRSSHKLPCGYTPPHRGDQLHVRTIKLSTMAFVQHVGTEKCVKMINDHFYRVCYSFHASYSELREVIMYLKPGRVYPNAVPTQCKEALIQERLNHFLKLAHKSGTPHCSQEARPLGTLKTKRKRVRQESSQFSDDMSFDFMDDSPSKKSKCEVKIKVKTSPKSEPLVDPQVKQEGKQEKEFVTSYVTVTVQDEDKPSSSKAKCDAKAFPLLFGGNESEDEAETETKNKAIEAGEQSQTTSDKSFHEGSQDLFADSESEVEFLPEDVKHMKSFKPVAGGSFGDYVGYVSEVSNDDEGSTDSEHRDTDERSNKILPVRDTGQSGATLCCEKRKEEKDVGIISKTSASNHGKFSTVSAPRKQPSLEIVDISEPENDSGEESHPGSSGRKRRISENILDPVQLPLKHCSASKSRKKRNSGSDDSVEEMPRPSVVRYPSSGFYSSSHSLERTHAVRGYHNLMTNIEKILKSPTRNSLSDDADAINHAAISNSEQQTQGASNSLCSNKTLSRGVNRKHEQLDYKHKKYRKYKTQPSACQSKPTEDSDSNLEASSTDTGKNDIKSESDRSRWFDKAEECIDLTADDEDEDVKSASSQESNAVDVISDDDGNNDTNSENSDIIADGSDVIEGDIDAYSCDVISDGISDNDNDRSGSSFEDGDGYENGASECISDGEAQNKGSVKSTKHRKHRQRHYELTSYSSDSDMDSAATYDSDEWYLSVSRVRKAMKKSGFSGNSKMKTSVSTTEVIVLDDSSNCSVVTRPNSVSVSTQVTSSPNKVSPLAHQSSESVVVLPSPVPKSWSRYGTPNMKSEQKKDKLKRYTLTGRDANSSGCSGSRKKKKYRGDGDKLSDNEAATGEVKSSGECSSKKRVTVSQSKKNTEITPIPGDKPEASAGSKQFLVPSAPKDNNNKSTTSQSQPSNEEGTNEADLETSGKESPP